MNKFVELLLCQIMVLVANRFMVLGAPTTNIATDITTTTRATRATTETTYKTRTAATARTNITTTTNTIATSTTAPNTTTTNRTTTITVTNTTATAPKTTTINTTPKTVPNTTTTTTTTNRTTTTTTRTNTTAAALTTATTTNTTSTTSTTAPNTTPARNTTAKATTNMTKITTATANITTTPTTTNTRPTTPNAAPNLTTTKRTTTANITKTTTANITKTTTANITTTPTTATTQPTAKPTERLQGYLLCPHQSVDLVCPSGKVLKIQYADYGRKQQYVCGQGKTTNCSTKLSTTAKMIEMCEGRRVCYVNMRVKWFVDACPGVSKYLHVLYHCVTWEENSNQVAYAPRPDFQPKCGISKSTSVTARVVEGTRSVPGKWPWQVSVSKGYRYKRFTCGGTLIHPRWVLTAAHCIRSRKKNYYTVRLGDYDRALNEHNEQEIRVKRAIRHPLYYIPYALNNDIALLELEKPATFNDRIGIACLPSENYELPVNDPNTRCYITGWGKTISKGYMSQMLRQVEVPPVDRKKCAVRLSKSPGGSNRKISKNMICGGNDHTGASACKGDSGGPYVCRNSQGYWEVHGVISWGSPICSLKQRFTVFAQVSKFRKWIDKYLNSTPNTT